jgi:hypothetical protein
MGPEYARSGRSGCLFCVASSLVMDGASANDQQGAATKRRTLLPSRCGSRFGNKRNEGPWERLDGRPTCVGVQDGADQVAGRVGHANVRPRPGTADGTRVSPRGCEVVDLSFSETVAWTEEDMRDVFRGVSEDPRALHLSWIFCCTAGVHQAAEMGDTPAQFNITIWWLVLKGRCLA